MLLFVAMFAGENFQDGWCFQPGVGQSATTSFTASVLAADALEVDWMQGLEADLWPWLHSGWAH